MGQLASGRVKMSNSGLKSLTYDTEVLPSVLTLDSFDSALGSWIVAVGESLVPVT